MTMNEVRSDIEIAMDATPLPIAQVAEKLGIGADEIDPYGRYKAKLTDELMDRVSGNPEG